MHSYSDFWPWHVDYLSSSPLQATFNLLWMLFTPLHMWTVTYLDAAERAAGETPEKFAQRVQERIACSLCAYPMSFGIGDKAKMVAELRNSSADKKDK